MFHVTEKVVLGMAGIRVLSSFIEMTGAILMLYFGTAAKALQVNAALALVGPVVLVSVTFLGVLGVADEMSWGKIVWIVLGVGCILYGAKG
ncbi:YqhV family protein [Alicyclobacillus pomorum]|uniref:YqhV family protein n=1 Tax=Alicyclobacillus pomorum TaxID=204470 RepID=UPI000403ECBA|nr:YqhV family protein [Alicyclobacillus pomorum]